MRILYAIQGTGNGHVSRAREIIPILGQHADVDLLLSGTQAEVELDQEVKYRFTGLGFIFGKKGGIDIKKTWQKMNFLAFVRDVITLPVAEYDIVISDYEPISAWACKLRRIKCIGMSHQAAFHSKRTPRLAGFHWGSFILNNYAPTTKMIGFHFKSYDDFIYTPIIRGEIRALVPRNAGHYTVYLPAYSDAYILDLIQEYSDVQWEVFSKHARTDYEKRNIKVIPIHNTKFQESLANCSGLLTGGGFEGPSEALYFGKKLLTVPMKNQYEQQCNALALEEMGIDVVWHESQFKEKLRAWIRSEHRVHMDYADQTRSLVSNLVRSDLNF